VISADRISSSRPSTPPPRQPPGPGEPAGPVRVPARGGTLAYFAATRPPAPQCWGGRPKDRQSSRSRPGSPSLTTDPYASSCGCSGRRQRSSHNGQLQSTAADQLPTATLGTLPIPHPAHISALLPHPASEKHQPQRLRRPHPTHSQRILFSRTASKRPRHRSTTTPHDLTPYCAASPSTHPTKRTHAA